MLEKETYMRRALALAALGAGYTNPNPMVGCVVVKDGRIIAEGYHEKYGQFHAERNALLACTEDPAGADLYVTLEPCCHHGKTPPCTAINIEKKIARVFIGALDNNPLVAGKGVEILKAAGISVESGILEAECKKLNEVFYHYMETKRPFLVMKYAMSLDGKIACATGDSKWVTGETARAQVHELRRRYAGIMVGIGTVLADDPLLNCRCAEGADPVRIVCDSRLRMPLSAQLVKTAKEIPTIVACSHTAFEAPRLQGKIAALSDAGIEIIPTRGTHGVNLSQLLETLGARGIDSVLLEGGSTLNASALREGVVDIVYAYIAGKLIGGLDAPTPVAGLGADHMDEVVQLRDLSVETVGEDICVTGYPVYPASY